MASNIVPITSLSPTSAPPADAAIRAVVTLIWPYSSSTKQCAVLLADPDFRLRNKKGQVRVRFTRSSAEAIALGKLGIGDHVLLELKGAVWVEGGGDAVRTPGKSVDGELAFAEEVRLQKNGGEWICANGSRSPPVQEPTQTPVAQNGGRMGLLRKPELGAFDGAVPIYSSPAFMRKTRLSGDGFGDGYDPFTEEYEDLDAAGPRKRARISFGGIAKWRLAGRTPSPEKEDQLAREAVSGTDENMEEDLGVAKNMDDMNGQGEATHSSLRLGDSAESSEMAPPSAARLQIPQVTSQVDFETQPGDRPSTPNLRPVSSPNLPLPSPFPAVDRPTDPVVEANRTAAATTISATASNSQQSLDPSQSLPDTAEPDEADVSSPAGIYAHNGAIEGTYREHVAHPEWLSDTEEDEGLYEEHMRSMREEAMRNEYNYSDDGSEVHEDDVDEIIDDMGEEPEDSSDDDVGEVEIESTSLVPAAVEIDDEMLDADEGLAAAENPSRQVPVHKTLIVDDSEKAAAHLPPPDEDSFVQEDGIIEHDDRSPGENPKLFTKDVPSAASIVSLKRKGPPRATPAPATPVKLPAGIFGLDGTSTTPQTTPQSERERIMARTYDSLFGFSNSPAPLQSLAQMPTHTGSLSAMGRVKTETGAELRTTSLDDTESLAPKAIDALLPPRRDVAEVEISVAEVVHAAIAQESIESHHRQVSALSEVVGLTEPKATEAVSDHAALQLEDVHMAGTSFTSANVVGIPHDVEVAPFEELAPTETGPAATLEAAMEGDIDMDASSSEGADAPNADVEVMGEPIEAASTIDAVIVEPSEIISESGTSPSPPAAVLPPSQVEVIELDSSSDEMEQEKVADDLAVAVFSGSPTEIDSEEELVEPGLETLSAASQAAAEEEDNAGSTRSSPERTVPETLRTQDAQSMHFDGSESDHVRADNVIPNTLQPQDPQVVPLSEAEGQESRLIVQPQIAGIPAMPSTQPKNNLSFHYFSFQSTTSAASDSLVDERQAAPRPEIAASQPRTKVIDLLSSSPALEPSERQDVDAAVGLAESEAKDVEDDERMSDSGTYQIANVGDSNETWNGIQDDEQMPDAEAFSPASSVAQRAAIDAGIYLDANAGNTEEAADVFEGDAQETSKVIENDEQMSDAEAFSPELSVAQQTSLHLPVGVSESADAAAAGHIPSNVREFGERHSEQPLGVTEPTSYTALPVSPEDSQESTFQTQLLLPAPILNTSHFPPTPQLTQGDSLIKEEQTSVEPVEVKPVEVEPAPFDPPSRHTRSSTEHTVVEALQSSQFTPDPPSRHTRSSVEPAADKQTHSPLPKTPVRKSKRRSQTRSQISVEPIEERKFEEEEDTIAVLSPLPKTPVRKSPRKVSKDVVKDAEMAEADNSPQQRSPAKKSFSARLSNVPDVISAWFSPRRSTRLHSAHEETEEETGSERPAFMGLSTAIGYYAPLSGLSQKMNSSARTDNSVDVIAVVTDSTKEPERAKTGPKDYFTCFKIWDPSLGHDTSILVGVFRPWKATLPLAEVGDVILLRGFAVKSRKRQPYLISSETSGWCVWRYAEQGGVEARKVGGKQRAPSFSGIREEIKGPPVELGKEERDHIGVLREAWETKV